MGGSNQVVGALCIIKSIVYNLSSVISSISPFHVSALGDEVATSLKFHFPFFISFSETAGNR